MDNKYYTPDITEFYVGFEYEWLDEEGSWNKATPTEITLDNYKEQTYGLRAKYLDQEDIESLGFEPYTFFEYKKDNYYIGLGISQEGGDTNREIIVRNSRADNDVIFKGAIKNKSELKRLLKQLGINE